MNPQRLSPPAIAGRFLLGAMLAATSMTGFAMTARAGSSHTFVIAGNSGYGITGCFVGGAKCGQKVADSWCASKGGGRAVAFGVGADITASLPSGNGPRIDPDSIIITCGE